MSIRCELIRASELSQVEMDAWARIQSSHSLYDSPHLRPELVRAIGQFNNQVYVGIAEYAAGQTAFFPHLRRSWPSMEAHPVPICDYQTCIAAASAFDLGELLRGWKLQAWRFDHLVALPELEGQVHISRRSVSYRVTLPNGFDEYSNASRSGRESTSDAPDVRRRVARRVRQIERELGELRFVPDCTDFGVLGSLFAWKAQRFNAGQSIQTWISRALEALMQTRTPGFSGRLSALYAGDRLISAHFGITSGTTLYYWFPAFNPEASKYSPGWVLIEFLLRDLQSIGCDTLDFGPGGESYKPLFANDSIPISGGYFERPTLVNAVRAAARYVEKTARSSPIARRILRPALSLLRK